MEEIKAIVIVRHWETESTDTFSFAEMHEAEKFATAIEEVDGDMSKWTGNTSESRALRKGHWQNTMRAEIFEIPIQSQGIGVLNADAALAHIRINWPESNEG